MTELLATDPSINQVCNNISLAESLAARSGRDANFPQLTQEREEALLSLLRNRLTSMQKTVQVGLLDRYTRICRKSSVGYPPLPITGLKACLYILKVSNDITDTPIKEKLAIVFENWRLLLEQEVGSQIAGAQSVWTCKALCQLSGRAEGHPNPFHPSKRKRSIENLNGSPNKNFSPNSLPSQRRRTSLSNVQPILFSESSSCNRSPSTPTTTQKNAQPQVGISQDPMSPQFNPSSNIQVPLELNKDHSVSNSINPNRQINPGAPTTEVTPSKTTTEPDPLRKQEPTPSKTTQLVLASGNGNSSESSRPASSSSTPAPSVVQPAKILSDSAGPLNTLTSSTPQTVVHQSSSSIPLISYKPDSRVIQSISHPPKPSSADTTTTATTTTTTTLKSAKTLQASVSQLGYSISPITYNALNHWQQACRLLDSALTELLEIMPLTAHLPPTAASVYKPKPYSPSFQWVPTSVPSYTPPPILSSINGPPILTPRPQAELHSPPPKSPSVSTPASSAMPNLTPHPIDSEPQPKNVLSNPPPVDSAINEKSPASISLSGPSSGQVLPPSRQILPPSQLVLPHVSTGNNQSNNIQPGLGLQQGQPHFHVTEAQKRKFVDTYRRVDAVGKAKLEATLRQNKLWEVLSPLLSSARSDVTSSSQRPITSSAIPPNIIPVSPLPNSSVPQPSILTKSQLPHNSTQPTMASTTSKSSIVEPAPSQSLSGSTHISDASKLMPRSTNTFDDSKLMPGSTDTSQKTQAVFDSGSLMIASVSEAPLDPTLTVMIKAMLGTDSQAHKDLMTAFETLGILNKEAIMTHLNALATYDRGPNDFFWKLRPELSAVHPSRLPQAGPSSSMTPPESTARSSDSTVPFKTQSNIAIPSINSRLLAVDTTQKVTSSTNDQSNPTAVAVQSISPSPLHSTTVNSSLQLETALDERKDDRTSPIADKAPQTSPKVLVNTTDKVEEELKDTDNEIEIITPPKKRPLNTETDISINDSSSPKATKNKLSSVEFTNKLSKNPSVLKNSEADTGNICSIDACSFRDDLPGFPDVDPMVQIQGTPARILSRYPADQQMPPIRTFAPLIKKVKNC